MAKLADYFISGVWKDSNDVITDVLLHTVNPDNSFQLGVKTSDTATISLIKKGSTVKTITWNYPDWEIGALVGYARVKNREYLRTAPNSRIQDNLDNSIDMLPIRK